MIQSLLTLLQSIQSLAGMLSSAQLKTLASAALAIYQGYLAAIQPVAGNPGIVALPAGGPVEPADPNDPDSSADFVRRTVPIPWATVNDETKAIADQTQNEQWLAGVSTAVSFLSMAGGLI